MPVQKKLIKNKNFRILFLGGGISMIGSYVVYMALIWEILEKSGRAGLLGIVMALTTIIPAIFSSFIGDWIDRQEKKNLMVNLDRIMGIIFIGLGMFFYFRGAPLYILVIVLILDSVFNVVYNLTLTAINPLLFDDNTLQKSMSANLFLNNFTNIIGISLAGILLNFFDFSVILMLDGATFIISSVFERFLKVNQPTKKVLASKMSLKNNFKSTFEYLKSEKMLGYFIHNAIGNLLLVGLIVVGLPYIYNVTFALPSEEFAFANAIFPLGATIAMFLFSFAPKIKNIFRFLQFDMMGQALIIVVLGLILKFAGKNVVPLFLVGIFSFAVVNAVSTVPTRANFMRKFPNDVIGKIYGVKHTFNTVSNGLSNLLIGFLLDAYPIGNIFIVLGILTLVTVAFNQAHWYEIK